MRIYTAGKIPINIYCCKNILVTGVKTSFTYCCKNKIYTGLQNTLHHFLYALLCKTTHDFSYTSVLQKFHTKHCKPVLVFLHTAMCFTFYCTIILQCSTKKIQPTSSFHLAHTILFRCCALT